MFNYSVCLEGINLRCISVSDSPGDKKSSLVARNFVNYIRTMVKESTLEDMAISSVLDQYLRAITESKPKKTKLRIEGRMIELIKRKEQRNKLLK